MGVDDSNSKLGYIYYENNSKNSVLKEEVSFTSMRGLEVFGEPFRKGPIKVEVPAGENRIILLDMVDKEYIFKCEYYSTIQKSIDEVKEILKEKGEKKQIRFDGKDHQIYYYVYGDEGGYLWMFENESTKTTFDGTFYFSFNNLKIEGRKLTPEDQYKVRLQPGEKIYMRMYVDDISKSWGYKSKLSFKVEEDFSDETELINKIYSEGEIQQ